MSEEIKTILEEIRFKAGIYRDHKKRDLSFNDEEKNCALLLDYIQQKENIIKEVREYIKNNSLYEQDYDYDYEENLVEYPPSDETARKILLEILDKVD